MNKKINLIFKEISVILSIEIKFLNDIYII